jgi:hypothetical protein
VRPAPLLLAVAAACAAPAPPSLAVEVACVPETHVLRQLCTVTLTDRGTGRPVEGARLILTADMPSMPLVHNVPPATALAGGRPGTYHGTLQLEMAGRWVVTVRVTAPVTDQFTQAIEVGSP